MNQTPSRPTPSAAGDNDATAPRAGRPVVVGEVLFDHFPDGRQRLGGAPFNVAWHLQGFGLDPLLVTRVGRDDSGERILDAMRGWGLDTAGVQRDDTAPSGVVEVDLSDGQPSFDIRPGQAYDNLDAATALAAVGTVEASLLYHGTLIARSPLSAAALMALRGRIPVPVFLDVNLRPPWWSAELVRQSLFGTRWAKLNRDELDLLTPDATPDGQAQPDPEDAIEAAATAFRRRFALDTVIVTRGAEGALMVDGAGAVGGTAPPVEPGGDSVGAGDAFSAVMIAGVAGRWPRDVTLRRALEFASLICSVQGAIVVDPTMYREVVGRWTAETTGASA